MIYKSLRITPGLEGQHIGFDIENTGNSDIEIIMLEVLVPDAIVNKNWDTGYQSGVDLSYAARGGVRFR